MNEITTKTTKVELHIQITRAVDWVNVKAEIPGTPWAIETGALISLRDAMREVADYFSEENEPPDWVDIWKAQNILRRAEKHGLLG